MLELLELFAFFLRKRLPAAGIAIPKKPRQFALKNPNFNAKNCIFAFILVLRMDKNVEEFYERLKVELDNSNTWPAEYLFKFIVPTVDDNVERVENAFDCMGAVIKTTKSKTGKFTSISVDVTMKDAQEIVDKYQEVGTIKGIVSL